MVLGLISNFGRKLIIFIQGSYREIKKISWPTRKETLQVTLVVFIFVFIIATYLWLSDKLIEWVIFSAILNWK